MALTSGVKLGPYEILAPLGAGGMGEVYQARDTRLGRNVALKILPESFALQSERLLRFEQEVRAVAALNHPNILVVFDVGKHNGSPFLVSELLEGETLRVLLNRGAIPPRKAIEYGAQITQGLAAAHDKGITHRDLKPENLFLTKDARIKILDFGLAKLTQRASAELTGSEAATLISLQTEAGVVMGTASYMAPEQVRGETADQRTDIFAVGAVMYEMLSGERAFCGDTSAETMTAVLKQDPPELSGSGAISPALDRIVCRCLEKEPAQRFQSVRDLSFALSALSGSDSARVAAPPAETPRGRSVMLWASTAALILVAAVAGFLVHSRATPARMQFAITVPGEVSQMALSPDGSMLAFVSPEESSGLPMLYLQRIGSASPTLLPGSEGACYPFWSPDGKDIAFFANGKLQKVPASGGAPQVLARVSAPRGGSWGTRNVILYAPAAGGALWRVNADGTGQAPATSEILASSATAGKLDATHRWANFLPDGNHFLFWAGNFGAFKDDTSSGIFVSSLDEKDKKLIVLCHSSFAYDSGHLYYADDQQQLVSIAFDPSTATVSGSPHVVANVVGFQPSTYWAALTVAKNGTLVYNESSEASLSALNWVDRSGKQLGRLGDLAVMFNPVLSPDGSRVALDISDLATNNVDVWLESTAGAGNSRFTFRSEEDVTGVWSRDGNSIAYRSNGSGGTEMFLKRSTGLQQEKQLLQISSTDELLPNSWTLDNQQILVTHVGPSGSHLELVSVADGTLAPFLRSTASETNGMISPDGKWVAYASNESGNWDIYVTTFPHAEGKWQVSRGGGTEPHWRHDTKEIFYISTRGILMSAQVTSQTGFATSTPAPLFQIHGRAAISSSDVFSYDVAKNGDRFLVNQYQKSDHIKPLTIVLNAAAR